MASNRLVERLVTAGKIEREKGEAAVALSSGLGGRVEEALLEVGAIGEADLLKFLAAAHKTRFVSTERLARADIDRATLDRVPKKLADQKQIFPVLFDADTATLSLVTADPDDLDALREVQVVNSGSVKDVRAFVARPAAVRAAINKAYNGDIHAFAFLDAGANMPQGMFYGGTERSFGRAENARLALGSVVAPLPHGPGDSTLPERGSVVAPPPVPPPPAPVALPPRGTVSAEAYAETLNVLVSLIENNRAELRGHSSHVARLTRKLCERVGLAEEETTAVVLAAHLHDLGKMGPYHLTAYNVAEYEGHRVSAEKTYLTPGRLLDGCALPAATTAAVNTMYDRFDGKGVASGTSGKDIPLGGRVLAIADTYADLTQNPRNPFRKTLRPVEACEVLAKHKGTIFDPNLVDLFKLTVTGEEMRGRLLGDRHVALIVDPDPEETTVIELRLLQQGFVVRIARTGEQAMKALESGEIEIVLSELDLPGTDGFALLEQVRQQGWGKELPWFVLTRRRGRIDAQRAFELGIVDFLTKPADTDVLVAKVKTLLAQNARGPKAGARGVSGSLSEMSLPDIVQILWHGRKTGALKVRSGRGIGEIHFVEGNIYNAVFGAARGADAFYAMLELADGDFALVPDFRAPQRLIEEGPEELLLEGMRRLDEGQKS